MANLSQIKREQMISFLEKLKEQHSDDESLIAINQIEKELTSKKYGLVWEEHEEEVDVKMQTHIPVFTEVKEREIVGNLDSEEYNFLLEGDNLHSLKLLEKTHRGKIDVIYIDPPYNTGSKDFRYDDSFVDVLDGFRHSKWISFMKKRLQIAKQLLTIGGCIFISIDDNEQAQLKLICDDILGAENFVANLVWAAGRKNDSKYISVSHEYILCYANSLDYLKREKVEWKERKQGIDDIYKEYARIKKAYGNNYEKMTIELRNWYKALPNNHPAKNHSHYNCIDENGIYFPSDISWPGGGGPKYEVLHPITQKPVKIPNRGWVYPTKERMDEIIAQGLVHFGVDESSVPCKKTYLVDNEGSTPYSIFYKDGRAATKKLRSLLGETAFQNPKDVEIIKNLLRFTANEESTILDFFAGSGTTGQAVMELNQEDGGGRHFILCTNNENNICEAVTYQRLKTVITGKRVDGSEYSERLPANLKYYKTDFVAKDSEEIYDDLLEHIEEMIQLQYGIKIDNKRYVIIMNDEEMDDFEKHFADYADLQAVFINQDVLFSTSQEKMLQSVNIYIIPDCYFDFELREAGELW
ncbi:MAG: site-specific DNA-methyltransferase [Clostridium sp.]|nr:site-specific DNA-methyltransferase [Clostridium sp.]